MKLLFVGYLYYIWMNWFCQMKTLNTPDDRYLAKIFAVYHGINNFENQFEATHSPSYQDSVIKYNDSLIQLLSNGNLSNLSVADKRKLKDSTGITISQSENQKINVFSWCVFEDTPAPLCSNIATSENGKPVVLSCNGSSFDNGYNIRIDTIIRLVNEEKASYLLIGSNRCGNLCLDYLAALYSLHAGAITERQKCFYDGKNYSDEVEFNYLVNEKIKSEPNFRVKHNLLFCPVFSEDGTRKIGNRSYKIVLGKTD